MTAANDECGCGACLACAHRILGKALEAARTQAAAPRATWQDAERISNLPAVDEAIRNLLEDQTGDNATGLVRAVLDAAGVEKVPALDYVEWKRRYAARLMHHGWNERAAIKEAEYVWTAMEGVESVPGPEKAADRDTADARAEAGVDSSRGGQPE